MTYTVVVGYHHSEKDIGGTRWVLVARQGTKLPFLPEELYELALLLEDLIENGIPFEEGWCYKRWDGRRVLERTSHGRVVRLRLCAGTEVLLIDLEHLPALAAHWREKYKPEELAQQETHLAAD